MKIKDNEVMVSVIIPVYNSELYLDKVLKAVFLQDYKRFEVIILYTHSQDKTEEICKNYNCRIIKINPKEFNHGATRNLGIRIAKGDFVAFLSHDAVPASSKWLQSLLQPMLDHEEVVAVFGRQIPNKNHSLFIKRDIEGHFNFYQINSGYLLYSKNDPKFLTNNKAFLYFYSDVNSSLRKSYWEKYPYKNIIFAEDLLFGKEVIESGFTKAYSADATVLHSHRYSLIGFFKRYFEEYRGLKLAWGHVDKINLRSIIFSPFYAWITEVEYIRKENYRISEKINSLVHSLILCFLRHLASFLGSRHEKLPCLFYSLFSFKKQEPLSYS